MRYFKTTQKYDCRNWTSTDKQTDEIHRKGSSRQVNSRPRPFAEPEGSPLCLQALLLTPPYVSESNPQPNHSIPYYPNIILQRIGGDIFEFYNKNV